MAELLNFVMLGFGAFLVFEGLCYAISPIAMKKSLLTLLAMDNRILRIAGFVALGFGLLIVWWIKN